MPLTVWRQLAKLVIMFKGAYNVYSHYPIFLHWYNLFYHMNFSIFLHWAGCFFWMVLFCLLLTRHFSSIAILSSFNSTGFAHPIAIIHARLKIYSSGRALAGPFCYYWLGFQAILSHPGSFHFRQETSVHPSISESKWSWLTFSPQNSLSDFSAISHFVKANFLLESSWSILIHRIVFTAARVCRGYCLERCLDTWS